MKNVLFVNRKGGCGKSTLCAEFVLSLRRSGIPVNFYDLDVQGGTILKSGEEPGAKVSAVDTPGAIEDDLREWIREADVIVIPTRPSGLDMDSLRFMVEVYEANRKRGSRLVIVVNQYTRWSSSREYLEWVTDEFSKVGADIATFMQSETVLQASVQDMSVVDFSPRSAAAQSALEVVNTIRRAAKLPEEQRR
jgi:chromosome partitioning protein